MKRIDRAALSLEPLKDRVVSVLGYGNQGRAHALNLRDSGVEVCVGQRPSSPGAERARADGFTSVPIEEATARGDLMIMALPDEAHGEVYGEQIAPRLKDGATLGFIHGLSVRFDLVRPRDDVGMVLVAPKGPGRLLRALFNEGKGLPCLFAVHRESSARNAEQLGLAWAAGIGAGNAGLLQTTFADETECDLFGEQAVLCGGMTSLMLRAFETLVHHGYDPELAYLECCHEMKQIADLIYEGGFTGMLEAISTTAEFGTYVAAEALSKARIETQLETLLRDVRSCSFADRLQRDVTAGAPELQKHRAHLTEHPIEAAGASIRKLMPWLSESG